MANKSISQLATGTPAAIDLVEFSKLSATVTRTATTISALASDNSYNDSGAGLVSAGFAVGQRVKVVGFTGDVANNIFSATITALTTTKMTIGGADGNVIVDDAAGESVTITKWDSKRTTMADVVALYPLPYVVQIAASDMTTELTTGVGKAYYRAHKAFTLTAVRASLFEYSSSGTVTIDINKNGTTVLSTKLTLDVAEFTSLSALTPAVISGGSFSDDDVISIDIDGAGTDAKGLIVTLYGT